MQLCGHVMKREVKCLSEKDSVHAGAKLMRDENIGFVPICNGEGKAIGVLTDRDIVVRLAADNASLEIPVTEIMSKPLVACSFDDKLSVAEARMRELKKSRILCIDKQGRPLGVISLSDVAQHERAGRVGRLLRALTLREARA
jgi:CBS domain-containing protein